MRIAVGPKDIANGTFEVARRDTLKKEVILKNEVVDKVADLMDEIQKNLFTRAARNRTEHTTEVSDYDEFKKVLETKGGFISAHWDGTSETEERIKNETKATIRCIPLNVEKEEGRCMVTGNPSKERVLFAKAY